MHNYVYAFFSHEARDRLIGRWTDRQREIIYVAHPKSFMWWDKRKGVRDYAIDYVSSK